MSTTMPPSNDQKGFDIYMSGYLLTREMIINLCLFAHHATPEFIKHMGPIDAAAVYFERRKVLEAPTLIRIAYEDKAQGGEIVERWMLPGKVVFFQPGTTPPTLSYDEETKAYLNTWLPPDLLHKDAFKSIRFVNRYWPRNQLPTGTVLHAIRLLNEAYRDNFLKGQEIWLAHMKKRDCDVALPPRFPSAWLV